MAFAGRANFGAARTDHRITPSSQPLARPEFVSIFWPFRVPAPASTVLSATPCTASDETATGAGVRCNVTDGAVRSGRAGRTRAECAVARRRMSEVNFIVAVLASERGMVPCARWKGSAILSHKSHG